jgi:uncharacterized protein
LVEQIAASLADASVEDLIQQPQAAWRRWIASKLSAGTYTVNDILAELRKPGRDPRDKFVAPSFRDEVRELPMCRRAWCWKAW